MPIGIVNSSENGKTYSDYTQWVAIKDLSHNQLYFADNQHRLNFVRINLDQVFAKNNAVTLAID